MLKEMRSNTKIILWIVVVAFVATMGLVWGADVLDPGSRNRRNAPRDSVGRVNGENITTAAYSGAVERAFAQYEQERGSRPQTDEEAVRVQNEAYDALVADVLINQEIRKRGIRALDEEILLQVRSNPPAEVRKMEAFQTNGQFDHEKYLAALSDSRYDWTSLEYYVRQQIPRLKLEQEIVSGVRVTEAEVRDLYARQNDKVKVTYAFFGPNDFMDREIPSSEEDLRAFYDAGSENYRVPDRVRLRCVRWPKTPSAEDEAVIREQVDEIRTELAQGGDFAELAGVYSEDEGTREKGGDLGSFGRGEMVKEFEDAAFSLKVGEVSGPVRTKYGFHLIKVEGREGDRVSARHILIKLEPSRRTLEDLWNAAAAFDSLALDKGLEAAAGEEGLEATTTEPFAKGGYIPGVGRSEQLSTTAFEEPEGAVFGPVEVSDAYLVCQIAEKVPSRVESFEEVQDRVKSDFEVQKRRELARARADQVAAAVAAGRPLEQAVPAASIRQAGPFSEATAAGGVTGDPAFVGTVFVLPVGKTSGVVETQSGYVVARVDERVPFSEEEYGKQKDMLRARLLQQKQQQAFGIWFNELHAAAKIEDTRKRGAA
jgi:peptidyl-prolyl cis-trans isomerase D